MFPYLKTEETSMQFRSLMKFWPKLRKIFAPLLAVVLCGCANTTFKTATIPYTETKPVTSIYVYSFLDLRKELGPNFLAEIKRQLSDALEKEQIATKQLWFGDSPLRDQFSLSATGSSPTRTTTNTSMRVPVGEVINATREDEKLFGASHRLIVFPSYVLISNGINLEVRWDLVDTKTNQIMWSTTSSSRHSNWLYRDENAERRAKVFVQNLIAELRKAKIISNHGT